VTGIIPIIRELPKTPKDWSLIFKRINDLIQYNDSPPGLVVTIVDGSVTLQKLQNITPDRLLGRDSSPAGSPEELTVTGGLEFTGSGIRRSALTGDVTAPAGSGTTTIADNAVTYAKIQDVTATDRVLGRATVGAGDIEEITCTAAGRALLDDADATAQRTTLGLGTAATRNTGTSGTTVPLLDGTNVHASGQFTAFGIETTATQQAANPDTSGATLPDLETEVNQLKAVLRTFGLIAT
jgi:hypothetical protein